MNLLPLLIPLDFGGCSFPAGESADALIYSHNMMKSDVPMMASMGVMPMPAAIST